MTVVLIPVQVALVLASLWCLIGITRHVREADRHYRAVRRMANQMRRAHEEASR